MVNRAGVQAARSMFEDVARRRSGGLNLAPDLVLDTFVEFAALEFDVPDSPDADALLFEYGVFSLTGRPLFTLSFVRQFEEHSGDYVQFRCEFCYEVDDELESLGKREFWVMTSGDQRQVEEWRAQIVGDSCWSLVLSKTPLTFEIGQSAV